MTWPVNFLVAPDGAERCLAVRLTPSPLLESQVTKATVPAPALLLHSSLRSLLLTLEVRLGERLHGGQQPHLAHLPSLAQQQTPPPARKRNVNLPVSSSLPSLTLWGMMYSVPLGVFFAIRQRMVWAVANSGTCWGKTRVCQLTFQTC